MSPKSELWRCPQRKMIITGYSLSSCLPVIFDTHVSHDILILINGHQVQRPLTMHNLVLSKMFYDKFKGFKILMSQLLDSCNPGSHPFDD